MESSRSTLNQRPKGYGRFWVLAIAATVEAICLLTSGVREEQAAQHQQTSFGTITDCSDGPKSENHCDYIFQVGERQYTGGDSVDLGFFYGETVQIYYDAQTPTINALDDFSAKARRDTRDAQLFALVPLGFLAYVVYEHTRPSTNTYRC